MGSACVVRHSQVAALTETAGCLPGGLTTASSVLWHPNQGSAAPSPLTILPSSSRSAPVLLSLRTWTRCFCMWESPSSLSLVHFHLSCRRWLKCHFFQEVSLWATGRLPCSLSLWSPKPRSLKYMLCSSSSRMGWRLCNTVACDCIFLNLVLEPELTLGSQ